MINEYVEQIQPRKVTVSGSKLMGRVILTAPDGTDITSADGVLNVSFLEHLTTFTQEYTADGSGDIVSTQIVAPIVNKHLGIQTVTIITDSASGTISVDLLTSTKKVIRLYPSKETSTHSGMTHIEGADNEGIHISATGIGAGKKVFIAVSYMIHNG